MDQEPWFGVELRHLSALSAVSREGSFRGAAERLGYVQSAVSQQVANLERLVGTRLVDRFRGSKEVHLTEAGELLVAHAEQILARMNAARADLAAQVDDGGRETLRVGVCQSIATGLLPDVLRRLVHVAPEIRVVPVEADDDDALTGLLERGAVDVALGDLVLDPSSFESHKVISDPCALLVQSDSDAAASGAPPSAAELAAMPLIALEGWRFLTSVEAWFAAEGLAPRFALRARTEATARAYVEAGLGAAILPALGCGVDGERIAVIDLAGVLPERRIALHRNSARGHAPSLEAFLAVTRETARKLADRRLARVAAAAEPTPAPVALAA